MLIKNYSFNPAYFLPITFYSNFFEGKIWSKYDSCNKYNKLLFFINYFFIFYFTLLYLQFSFLILAYNITISVSFS